MSVVSDASRRRVAADDDVVHAAAEWATIAPFCISACIAAAFLLVRRETTET
jgi:hypothetical protein